MHILLFLTSLVVSSLCTMKSMYHYNILAKMHFFTICVKFDHLHYFRELKMLSLERLYNSLSVEVLQAYVWKSFELSEKILLLRLAIISPISEIS